MDALLDHAGGLDRYRRDAESRRRIERQFEQSLRQMVTVIKRAGVPLILCIPASDLVNTPPFKIEADAGLSASQRAEFDTVWEAAGDSDLSDAARLAACRRCLRLDLEHAGGHFVLGTLLHSQITQGQPGSREQIVWHLTAARDHDVCPLRATSRIADSVRQVAEEERVPYIDVRSLFDTRSVSGIAIPDGLPDPEWFVDHVHPTIPGHQRIAAALADRIEDWGWIRQTAAGQQRYEARAAKHLSSLGEAYYQRGQERLEALRHWTQGRSSEAGTGGLDDE